MSHTNLKEEEKDGHDTKEEWRKKLGLSRKMDINVVYRYITYNALSVNLTVTIQACGGYARSKEKACAVREKTYKRLSQPGESIFVDMTGPFLESLIGNQYWIGIVDDCSRYSWSFSKKTKSQLPKNMVEFFKNMTSPGTSVK